MLAPPSPGSTALAHDVQIPLVGLCRRRQAAPHASAAPNARANKHPPMIFCSKFTQPPSKLCRVKMLPETGSLSVAPVMETAVFQNPVSIPPIQRSFPACNPRQKNMSGGGPSWAKIAVVLGVATLLCGITVFYGNLGGGGRGGGDSSPAISPPLGEHMMRFTAGNCTQTMGWAKIGAAAGRYPGQEVGAAASGPALHPCRSPRVAVRPGGG